MSQHNWQPWQLREQISSVEMQITPTLTLKAELLSIISRGRLTPSIETIPFFNANVLFTELRGLSQSDDKLGLYQIARLLDHPALSP